MTPESPKLVAHMTRNRSATPDAGRYTYAGVTREIAEWLSTQPRGTRKQLAAALGMTDSQLAHRMRGLQSRFTIEHLGLIADFARAPLAWPLVPWEVANALESALGRRR